MSTSTLTVGSTTYTQSGRKSARLLVDGFGWDLDSDYWLEFHEYAAVQTPQFDGPRAVTLTEPGGTLAFAGDIISVQPTWAELGRTWGYRCLGLKNRANWIPVTAVDGSGTIRYNVDPSTNLDYYIPSLAGLSVGAILSNVLSTHSTALTAAGITTDGTTASGLAALTLVPSLEVEVSGDRLWVAMEGVLQQWARNIRLVILPSGLVRVVDVTAGTAVTLTCGADPIDPPMLARNWSNCATAVVCRGLGTIEAGYVSTLDGSLTPAWNSAEQNDWNYASFADPAGAIDSGTVTTVGSATSVTIQSSNPATTWATNYWNGIQAWISLVNTSLSGLAFTETRPIASCASMSAGGTCVITLEYPLQNSASNAYSSYHIIGTSVPLSSGGLSSVWRLYDVTDPGLQIADHLVRQFPVRMPFVSVNGTSASLTLFPTCQILYNGVGGPEPFTIDPVHGQVLFTNPVVELGNSSSVLAAGGAGVVAPSDIYMMLAYGRGALTTRYPTSGFSGTGYSVAGLSRVQTVDVAGWSYAGNTSVITPLAQMLQTSTRDTVVEGTIHYSGWYSTCLDPTPGYLISLAGNGYTTGDESLGASLRAYSVRFVTEGGGLNYTTDLSLSTRKDPRTGEGYYSHLSQLGTGAQLLTAAAGFADFNDAWRSMGGDIAATIQGTGGGGTDFDLGPDSSGADEMELGELPGGGYERDPTKRHGNVVRAAKARAEAGEKSYSARAAQEQPDTPRQRHAKVVASARARQRQRKRPGKRPAYQGNQLAVPQDARPVDAALPGIRLGRSSADDGGGSPLDDFTPTEMPDE